MRRHLIDLGFRRDVEVHAQAVAAEFPPLAQNYLNWLRDYGGYLPLCRAVGLSPTFDKSAREIDTEAEAIAAYRQATAKRDQQMRNPRVVIAAACRRQIEPEHVPAFATVIREIQSIQQFDDPAVADKLLRFLLWADKETELITGSAGTRGQPEPTIRVLVRMFERRRQWVRRPDTWKRTSHNPARQASSLLRHLFTQFPVPAFMDEAWRTQHRAGRKWRDWFLHIGSGQNIRTAKGLPLPLSSRAAHFVLECPADATIVQALRYGEVRALGGDERLWRAIVATRMPYEPTSHPFWTSVIRFFIAQPLLERRHVGPIVDYLLAQRFEGAVVVRADGTRAQLPPPQPNLSMRGRTPETLLAQVAAWHRRLGRAGVDAATALRLVFTASGLPTLRLRDPSLDDVEWVFRELTTAVDLQLEGRRLQHCVWTYAAACARGDCTIWSLERHTPSTQEPRLTIEVSANKEVVQVRGLQNRMAQPVEVPILRLWAKKVGFTIRPYGIE
jgi:hypothetical protein